MDDDYSDIALDPFGDDQYSDPNVPLLSDVLVDGDGGPNVLPTIGDTLNQNSASPFSGITKLLGSASSIGTAVGTAERQITTAGQQFTTAKNNAATGNSLGTFWQYASGTDKAVILIGVATLVYMIASHK